MRTETSVRKTFFINCNQRLKGTELEQRMIPKSEE
jgi:hypothetical protein